MGRATDRPVRSLFELGTASATMAVVGAVVLVAGLTACTSSPQPKWQQNQAPLRPFQLGRTVVRVLPPASSHLDSWSSPGSAPPVSWRCW